MDSSSSSDDLTRSVLAQSRSEARRRVGAGGRLSPSDESENAADVINPTLAAALHDSPPPVQPEPRYLHYLVAAAAQEDTTIEIADEDPPVSNAASIGNADLPLEIADDDLPASSGEIDLSHDLRPTSHSPPDSDVDSETSFDVSIVRSPNAILSVPEYSKLPLTGQPRELWIPNYRTPSRRSSAEIVPWDPNRIAHICVRTLDLELLFHHFSKPRNFLFPQRSRGRDPPSGTWASSLITQHNVEALYARTPWHSLNVATPAISFPMTGWYCVMATRYLAIEAAHLQAIWESTHAFPISSAQRRSSAFFSGFWKQRKQRRSRFGARWKSFLKTILAGMMAGHCDLDIMVDPFFLHFPRPREARVWYPGLGRTADPANMIEALEIADREEPWRLQFRHMIQDHPGMSIPRIRGKFLPASLS